MLKKINRITKKKEIDNFFGREFKNRKGYSSSSKFFVVKSLPAATKESRLNIILNTKVDKRASVRNKIKRQIRESFRLFLPALKNNRDILIVVLPSVTNKDYEIINKDLKSLFKKLRLL